MSSRDPYGLALLALDVGAYAFMRLYGRDGTVRTPGLVLADNTRARSIINRIPLVQRLALSEAVSTELLTLGAAALERASAGRSVVKVDALMSQLADPDEAVVSRLTDAGFEVDRVSHEDATADLVFELSVQKDVLIMERQTVTMGAPRDPSALRLRTAGRLLWLDLSGAVDSGPRPVPRPREFLDQLKEDGIQVKRAFEGSVSMRRQRGAQAGSGAGMNTRRPRRSAR